MVIRNGYVSRIADNVNDALVARIETIMGSNDARSRHAGKIPLRQHLRGRTHPINIAPVRGGFGESQVGYEKTGPGISRFWVGNKKRVIGKNEEVAPRL